MNPINKEVIKETNGIRGYPIDYSFVGCNDVTKATVDNSNKEVKKWGNLAESIIESARREIDGRLYIEQLTNGRFELNHKNDNPAFIHIVGHLNEKHLNTLLVKLDFAIQMIRLSRSEA